MKEWAIIVRYGDDSVSVEYFRGLYAEARIAALDALKCGVGELVTVAEVFNTLIQMGRGWGE